MRNRQQPLQQYRSAAALKLKEIDKRCHVFSRLAQWSSASSSPPSVLVAVDFGASPGGFAQVLRDGLQQQELRGPRTWNVVTVDNRAIDPPIGGTVHVRSSMEERKTMQRVRDLLAKPASASSTARSSNSGSSGALSGGDVAPPRNRRVVVVTNDTVAIVRGRYGLNPPRRDAGGDSDKYDPRQQLSVTYAQNNLVMCAMRRSIELLDCFQRRRRQQEQEQNEARPPCFFITKLLRSVHQNHVIDKARCFFDDVQLLNLSVPASTNPSAADEAQDAAAVSPSSLERYLVCSVQPESKHAGIPWQRLSLPPASPHEAREWMCYGCFSVHEGTRLTCPRCSR